MLRVIVMVARKGVRLAASRVVLQNPVAICGSQRLCMLRWVSTFSLMSVAGRISDVLPCMHCSLPLYGNSCNGWMSRRHGSEVYLIKFLALFVLRRIIMKFNTTWFYNRQNSYLPHHDKHPANSPSPWYWHFMPASVDYVMNLTALFLLWWKRSTPR